MTTVASKSIEEKLIESAKRRGATEPRALTTGDLCGLADHYRELARQAFDSARQARDKKQWPRGAMIETAYFAFSTLEREINEIVGGILSQRVRNYKYQNTTDMGAVLVENHWLAKVLAVVASQVAYVRVIASYRIETWENNLEYEGASANVVDWLQQEAGKLTYFVGRFTNDAALVPAEIAKTLFDRESD